MNQWLTLRKSEAGSNLVDAGRYAARDVRANAWMSTPKPCSSGGQEAMVKACGVAVAMLSE